MSTEMLSLRERQLEYLRILKELNRFFYEKNLRYYITAGTLLGAVRHKGFIPWDDDLDVVVPRPDFMRMTCEYKSSDFNFQHMYNDKSHPYPFGRLCSNRVFSLFRNKRLYNFGIDVYIINGAPSNKEEQEVFMDEVFVHIKRKQKLQAWRDALVRRGLWMSKNLDFSLMNRELLKAEELFEHYDYETSEYIWPFGGGRQIMKKENYGNPILLPFEDGLFMAPEHYHEVLTQGYGDYMQLPPVEQRIPYHGGDFYWE